MSAVIEDVVKESAATAPSSCSRGRHFELQLPGNRLRCGCCGRQVSAHAFDIVEPNLIRAVCLFCHVDLVTIEMRGP